MANGNNFDPNKPFNIKEKPKFNLLEFAGSVLGGPLAGVPIGSKRGEKTIAAEEANASQIRSLLGNARTNLEGSTLDPQIEQIQKLLGSGEGSLAAQETELKTQAETRADDLRTDLRRGEQLGAQSLLDDAFLQQRARQAQQAQLGTVGSGAGRALQTQERLAQSGALNQLLQDVQQGRVQVSNEEARQLLELTQSFDEAESAARANEVALAQALEQEKAQERLQLETLLTDVTEVLDGDFSDTEKDEKINSLLRLSGLDFGVN